jgi:Lar family restriction alleviation protein
MSNTELHGSLKPCPFCGGSNICLPFGDPPEKGYINSWVTCSDCDCDGPTSNIKDPLCQQKVIENWNKRP